MGLLDDAIREHLELKRLQGADPELVAREERDALGAVRGDRPAETHEEAAPSPDPAAGPAESSPKAGSQTSNPQDFSNVGQETAELDMRAVLGEESDSDATTTGPIAAGEMGSKPTPTAPSERDIEDHWLDSEMSGNDASGASVEPAAGNPHDGESASQPGEQVEDVLEETPDFLRDTPEQERLWFEQRPPRDFDFD